MYTAMPSTKCIFNFCLQNCSLLPDINTFCCSVDVLMSLENNTPLNTENSVRTFVDWYVCADFKLRRFNEIYRHFKCM
jgi:hypothetical protein